MNASLPPLATLRVPVSSEGYRQLRRFASRWPQASWAIEGAGGLGAPLTTRLSADGIAVVDVPANLAARVRLLSRGHGRKTDTTDATSVGMPYLPLPGCPLDQRGAEALAGISVLSHVPGIVLRRLAGINGASSAWGAS